jgi:hypothetical protein
VCCFGLLFSHVALASSSPIGEQLGIRSRAMGGAGRAVSTTNEALVLNPAGILQFKRFNLDGDYVHRMNEKEHYVGLSLVDARSRPFAGGVDFHLGIDPTQGNKSLGYIGSVALAYPVTEDRLMIGSTVRYAFLAPSTLGDLQVNQFTMDFGLLARLPYGFSFAAVGYSLVPTKSKRLPLSVGLGIAFNSDDFSPSATNFSTALSGITVAFDWMMRDLTSVTGFENQLMTGAEYPAFGIVPLRAGYTYSLDTREHVVTCGTGFASNDIGIDGFYEQNLTTLDDRSFGVAVRLLF